LIYVDPSGHKVGEDSGSRWWKWIVESAKDLFKWLFVGGDSASEDTIMEARFVGAIRSDTVVFLKNPRLLLIRVVNTLGKPGKVLITNSYHNPCLSKNTLLSDKISIF
jgi:hypothetical protein